MTLVLVDMTNLVMRAASAVCGANPDAPEAQRLDVDSTCFGMVEKVCRLTEATHVILCWDSPFTESERRKLYPGYKANRTGKTAYWVHRIQPQFEDAHWFGCAVPGWEADDVIATLTTRAAGNGRRPYILSNDSDLLSFAAEAHCYQFGRPSKFEPWIIRRPPEYVLERYGVLPGYLLSLKALAGEPSDDMPGPFGKHCIVRATRLLTAFNALEHPDPIEFLIEQGHLVGDFVERARLARDVLRLRTDLPIPPIMPAECRVPGTY